MTPQLKKTAKPQWREPSMQFFRDQVAMDDGDTIAAWVDDVQLSIGMVMENCREWRHDDESFRFWYQEIREAAYQVSKSLEHLQEICKRYE